MRQQDAIPIKTIDLKFYLALFFFYLICFTCSGQLLIPEKLETSNESIIEFIQKNGFDSALITWSSSNSFNVEDHFFCLIQRGDKSQLVEISVLKHRNGPKTTVKTKQVGKEDVNVLSKLIKSDSTFSNNQKELDTLARGCPYVENNVTYDGNIYDGGYIHLLRYTNKKFDILKAYAPRFYVDYCSNRNSKFNILHSLINTHEKLVEAVKASR